MTKSLASVAEVIEAVNSFQDSLLMYRGQSRDWPLIPAIGRHPVKMHATSWREFHDEVTNKFIRLGLPYLKSVPKSDVEKWVYAQHYGVPTRLLDTTLNPLKALHFSSGNPLEDEKDGAFWIIEYTGWREDLDEKYREYWDKEITPFLPAQIHPRLTAQEGAFICYPLPEGTDPLIPFDQLKNSRKRNYRHLIFHKFIVPAVCKPKLRREISALGAKYSLLFPDLDGVAREILLGLSEN